MNYSFTLLNSSMTIGDSLSAINNNSLILDEWLFNIRLSSSNYWEPFINYYANTYKDWDRVITIANNNVDKWKSVSTFIETQSSFFIEPITVLYPTLFLNSDSNITNKITTWVNTHYPIISNETENVNYVEGQKLIVYYIKTIKQNRANTTRNFSDKTTCSTADSSSGVTCIKEYEGYFSKCNWNCKDHTQRILNSYKWLCGFEDGADGGKNQKKYSTNIAAKLIYMFDDVYETDPIPVYYKVSNCKWSLINSI